MRRLATVNNLVPSRSQSPRYVCPAEREGKEIESSVNSRTVSDGSFGSVDITGTPITYGKTLNPWQKYCADAILKKTLLRTLQTRLRVG